MPRSAPGSSSAGHPGPRRDPVLPLVPLPSPATTAATLLLNATYEPLCVVSSRRAIVLVLAAKAESVDVTGDVVHAETVSLPVPVVARLTRYVRVPYPVAVPLSRRAVFTRDAQTCVYCGGSATSIDHVVPRSRVICSAFTPSQDLHDDTGEDCVLRDYRRLPQHGRRRLSRTGLRSRVAERWAVR
ncbi:HNH endonuclease [Blastococcus sp. TBT05-19]|uniref:HNH endonuclease n=1 Tax=Blastococcus sp. TBT05-19 TaxID=2250581 RepID=UPI001F43A969|nr:HNH endonuclease [Blastococcus sp. TBT05-19]